MKVFPATRAKTTDDLWNLLASSRANLQRHLPIFSLWLSTGSASRLSVYGVLQSSAN